MNRVNIRPLSVNEGYRGRRFHTKEHKIWSQSVNILLPNSFKLPLPPFEIKLRFGMSSSSSDFDNPTKFFIDSLATKYRFNDKLIRKGTIEKTLVPKGKEFIEWDILKLEPEDCPKLLLSQTQLSNMLEDISRATWLSIKGNVDGFDKWYIDKNRS